MAALIIEYVFSPGAYAPMPSGGFSRMAIDAMLADDGFCFFFDCRPRRCFRAARFIFLASSSSAGLRPFAGEKSMLLFSFARDADFDFTRRSYFGRGSQPPLFFYNAREPMAGMMLRRYVDFDAPPHVDKRQTLRRHFADRYIL